MEGRVAWLVAANCERLDQTESRVRGCERRCEAAALY
jgi:hypothetical protein